jgi:hypothetical protein
MQLGLEQGKVRVPFACCPIVVHCEVPLRASGLLLVCTCCMRPFSLFHAMPVCAVMCLKGVACFFGNCACWLRAGVLTVAMVQQQQGSEQGWLHGT